MYRIQCVIALILVVLRATSYAQQVTVVSDNDFANNPFVVSPAEQNILKLIKGKISITKSPAVNDGRAPGDTLVRYKSECCTFSFLRSKGVSRFSEATILGSDFVLKGRIKTGMSKVDFARVFNISSERLTSNALVVGNSDGLCNHSFYFENDTLATIVIDGCL